MTTTYTKTDNFGLNLYGDNDPADLRDGYNNSMLTIDNDMLTISQTANDAKTNVIAATTAAGEAKQAAAAAQSTADKGVSDAATAQSTADDAKQAAAAAQSTADKGVADAATAQSTADTAQSAAQSVAGSLAGNYYTKHDCDSRFQPIAMTRTHIMVTFGDSYGINSSEPLRAWPNALLPKLQKSYIPGLVLKNYSVGGSGYLEPNGTYQQEFSVAQADTSYDHSDVDLVIIGGSRNTLDAYNDNLRLAAMALMRDIAAEYPNARIINVPLMWDWTAVSTAWRQNASQIDAACSALGFECVPWAWTWLRGEDQYFTSGDIHPNAAGTDIIANYINLAILDRYHGRYCATAVRHPTNPAAYCLSIVASGGFISYGYQAHGGNTATDLTPGHTPTLPKWCWPSSDWTNNGNMWTTSITNGANNATLLQINSDGTWGLQGYTINPTGTPNGAAGVQFTAAW